MGNLAQIQTKTFIPVECHIGHIMHGCCASIVSTTMKTIQQNYFKEVAALQYQNSKIQIHVAD